MLAGIDLTRVADIDAADSILNIVARGTDAVADAAERGMEGIVALLHMSPGLLARGIALRRRSR
ncbi:MAG TPA: hypothetical protein VGP50_06155 [Stellaceae bacterium]|jgi:hypothetical protein|nr:hypothetical protein [Stellaceae bacterium]